jgi:hypothetical protein
LWQAVVELARRHGVSRTAQALRLDYYSIKKRLEAAQRPRGTREAPESRFVELPLRAVPAPPACVLEVEDGRGARLRVELQGFGAGELAGLVRTVWSEPR